MLIGQGVVWYSGQFWALYFLQQVSKVDPLNSAYIVEAALLLATPSLIFFGWLSDIIGMVYGPVGAFLAEYFPGRIRCASVSVPYHIGNGWGGGLVPFITSAAFAATGSIGYALIYPIAVPFVCFLLALWLIAGDPHGKHMGAG